MIYLHNYILENISSGYGYSNIEGLFNIFKGIFSLDAGLLSLGIQSFGSGINCQRVGSIGDIGCFSFYPTKNLGCYGDGGLITTNSEEICQDIKKLKNHGVSKRYHHDIIGYNSRLDEIQAAILNIKLKYVDQFLTVLNLKRFLNF